MRVKPAVRHGALHEATVGLSIRGVVRSFSPVAGALAATAAWIGGSELGRWSLTGSPGVMAAQATTVFAVTVTLLWFKPVGGQGTESR